MSPTQQHLHLFDRAARQADLRLEAQRHLAARDRLAQVAGQAQAAQVLLVLPVAVHGCAAAVLPRLLAGDVGAAQQGVGIGAMRGNQRDADAGVGQDPRLRQAQRVPQLRQQLVGIGLHRGGIGVRQHNHEFVAAEPADPVRRAHRLLQPAPGVDQHLVGEIVAEAVVEFLEALQVQHQHRGGTGIGLAGLDHGLQVLQQRRAVGHPGQRIVPRLVQDVLLATGDAALHGAEAAGQLGQFGTGVQRQQRLVVAVLDTPRRRDQLRDRAADPARQEDRRHQRGQRGHAGQDQDAQLQQTVRRVGAVQRGLQRDHDPAVVGRRPHPQQVARLPQLQRLRGRRRQRRAPQLLLELRGTQRIQGRGQHLRCALGGEEGRVQPGGADEILAELVAGFAADRDPADPLRRQHLHQRQTHEAPIQQHDADRTAVALRLPQQRLHGTQLLRLRQRRQPGQELAVSRQQQRAGRAHPRGVVAQCRLHGRHVAAGHRGAEAEIVGQHRGGLQQLLVAALIDALPHALARAQFVVQLRGDAAPGRHVHGQERQRLGRQHHQHQQRGDAGVQPPRLHRVGAVWLRRNLSCSARMRGSSGTTGAGPRVANCTAWRSGARATCSGCA
ncbi:hypothetical protein NB723_003465 [Xanthomonas sacchari]|nr:hypothetical protein [Xanthomonas sacchari]